MKHFTLSAALLGLTACMTPPPSVPGTIPFTQVLAETQGRPFECLNYDARTDTCEAITTYASLGGNVYSSRSRSIFDEAGGQVDVTGTFSALNGQICSDASDLELTRVSGQADLQGELAMATVVDFLKDEGVGCVGFFRGEGDVEYTARYTSGSEFFMQTNPQSLTYFDAPKRLRPVEL